MRVSNRYKVKYIHRQHRAKDRRALTDKGILIHFKGMQNFYAAAVLSWLILVQHALVCKCVLCRAR